jgi:hypothetical protein
VELLLLQTWVESQLTLNGWKFPFVNGAKYLGIIFDWRITCSLQIKIMEAKAFRTFTRIYALIKSERLNANFKVTLHKALIGSVTTYACPGWEIRCRHLPLKIAAPKKQGSPHHWKFSKVHTGPRFTH